MLPPTVKQFFFKLLISIFVHDYKNVLRQYRQAYTTQRQMEQYLRVITPEDLYDKELVRISERMSDLKKLIYQLRKKGLSDEAISRKLNLPLHKIQKHLDLGRQKGWERENPATDSGNPSEKTMDGFVEVTEQMELPF